MSEVNLSLGVLNEPSIDETPSEINRQLGVLIAFKEIELLNIPIEDFVCVGDEFVSNSSGKLIKGNSG